MKFQLPIAMSHSGRCSRPCCLGNQHVATMNIIDKVHEVLKRSQALFIRGIGAKGNLRGIATVAGKE